MERDEWQRLQIELSIRPTAPDGTIYHTELNVPKQQNEPQLFHNIALKKGHVVYTYDMGAGAGRIQIFKAVSLDLKTANLKKIESKNYDTVFCLLIATEQTEINI